MKTYLIYGHYLGNKCIYVGCGSDKRPWDFYRRNINWKKVVGDKKPSVVIFDSSNDFMDALSKEKYHIGRLQSEGHKLANKPVAKYWLGKKRDPELIKKMVEASRTPEAIAKRSEALRGRKHTEDHKQKISATLKTMPRSEEWNKAISDAKKGRSNGLEGRTMPQEHRLKISQSRKASDKVKASGSKIWEARRRNGTASGFNSSKAKPVQCVDTGKVYRCAKEAADELKLSAKHIQACCTGRRKTHGRLKWKYHG